MTDYALWSVPSHIESETYKQMAEILGQGSAIRKAAVYRAQQEERKELTHISSGIRTHNPCV
jgi:hypothetical protein